MTDSLYSNFGDNVYVKKGQKDLEEQVSSACL